MLRLSLTLRRVILLAAIGVLLTACSMTGGDDSDTILAASPATEASTTAAPITIMPIGGSSTQGATGWKTYRCFLDAMLEDAGVDFDFVGTQTEPEGGEPYGCPNEFDQDYEGFWGAHIQHLVDDVTASVEALQPDVALIHIGPNDIGADQEPVSVAEELESFVTGLQAVSPDITVFVAQIIQCNMPLPKCTENVPAFNDAIASFASLSIGDSSVIVVDMATGYNPDHYRDAVHPDEAGEEFIADRWMTALRESGTISSSG